MMDAEKWEIAACRDEDPELFFPMVDSDGRSWGSAIEQERAAKAVCRSCPIMIWCLEWALKTGQEAGVWGATTQFERENWIRAQRRIQPDAAATS